MGLGCWGEVVEVLRAGFNVTLLHFLLSAKIFLANTSTPVLVSESWSVA